MAPTDKPLDLFTLQDVLYAVTVAGQLVFDSDQRLDELVAEVPRVLEREMHGEVEDRVAIDGSNASLSVSGEAVGVRVNPSSVLQP